MQFPVDVLDYIFSFLVSERKTLIACSKDPLLSPIIERHVYHHIRIVKFRIRDIDLNDAYHEPNHLVQLVSEKPHNSEYPSEYPSDSFANTLLKFPALTCIMLTSWELYPWCFPGVFRAALEDRLKLPSVTNVHLTGEGTPLSFLCNADNVKDLSISGYSRGFQFLDSTFLNYVR